MNLEQLNRASRAWTEEKKPKRERPKKRTDVEYPNTRVLFSRLNSKKGNVVDLTGIGTLVCVYEETPNKGGNVYGPDGRRYVVRPDNPKELDQDALITNQLVGDAFRELETLVPDINGLFYVSDVKALDEIPQELIEEAKRALAEASYDGAEVTIGTAHNTSYTTNWVGPVTFTNNQTSGYVPQHAPTAV